MPDFSSLFCTSNMVETTLLVINSRPWSSAYSHWCRDTYISSDWPRGRSEQFPWWLEVLQTIQFCRHTPAAIIRFSAPSSKTYFRKFRTGYQNNIVHCTRCNDSFPITWSTQKVLLWPIFMPRYSLYELCSCPRGWRIWNFSSSCFSAQLLLFLSHWVS